MSKTELSKLRDEFELVWLETQDYQKILFATSIRQMREGCYRSQKIYKELNENRNFLQQKIIEFTNRNKTRSVTVWAVIIIVTCISYFQILDQIFNILIYVILLSTLIVESIDQIIKYIDIKSIEIKIHTSESALNSMAETQFPISLSHRLQEDIGSDYGLSFSNDHNEIEYIKIKIRLLNQIIENNY